MLQSASTEGRENLLVMLEQIEHSSFESFFAEEKRLLDVRAPVEFEKACIPGAINVPILSNEDRTDVGISYKQHGSAAAVVLGEQRVSGAKKDALLEHWREVIKRNKIDALYCARGGLRSRYSQRWLDEAGVVIPRVQGGYKAMRRFLLGIIERESLRKNFLVISGKTGVGKTRFLEARRNAGYAMLHLEEMAKHRGSAFGALLSAQPSQAFFENTIALCLLRMTADTILVESESRTIGKMRIPDDLFHSLSEAPRIVLELDLSARVQATIDEYILSMERELREQQVENPSEVLRKRYRNAIMRIAKRLGGVRSAKLLTAIDDSFSVYASSGDADVHAAWVEPLLVEYYDPMYAYSLEQNRNRILFQGTEREVEGFVMETCKGKE